MYDTDTLRFVSELEAEGLPPLTTKAKALYDAENARHKRTLENYMRGLRPLLNGLNNLPDEAFHLHFAIIPQFILNGLYSRDAAPKPIVAISKGLFYAFRLIAFYMTKFILEERNFSSIDINDTFFDRLNSNPLVDQFLVNLFHDVFDNVGPGLNLSLHESKGPDDVTFANRVFDGALSFAFGHELSHCIYRHGGRIGLSDFDEDHATRKVEFGFALKELQQLLNAPDLVPTRSHKRNFFGYQTREVDADLLSAILMIEYVKSRSPRAFEALINPHLIGMFSFFYYAHFIELINKAARTSMNTIHEPEVIGFHHANSLTCRTEHPHPMARIKYLQVRLWHHYQKKEPINGTFAFNYDHTQAIFSTILARFYEKFSDLYSSGAARDLPEKWRLEPLRGKNFLGLTGADDYLTSVYDQSTWTCQAVD